MDGYLGQIIMFAGTYPPRNWAFCQGQLLPINSNTALYSLLGITYGGDGRTSFSLPNLMGRVPVGVVDRNYPQLPNVALGNTEGTQETVLNIHNLPPHTHKATISGLKGDGEVTISIPASSEAGNSSEPGPTSSLAAPAITGSQDEIKFYSTQAADSNLKPFTAPVDITSAGNVRVNNTGNGIAFNNVQPSLGMHFIICVLGDYPARNQ
jgi:microcystin-dependent protein